MIFRKKPNPEPEPGAAPSVEELDFGIRQYLVVPPPGRAPAGEGKDLLIASVGEERADELIGVINRQLLVGFKQTSAKQLAQRAHVPEFGDEGFETAESAAAFRTLVRDRAFADFRALHPGFSEEAMAGLLRSYMWSVADRAAIYKIGDDLYVMGFMRTPRSWPASGTIVHHQEFDGGLARSLQTVLMETELDAERPKGLGSFHEPLAKASGIASWEEFKEAGGVLVSIRSTRETIKLIPSGGAHGKRRTPTFYSTMDGRECLAAIIDAFSQSY